VEFGLLGRVVVVLEAGLTRFRASGNRDQSER
jgi:hypothetical protein